MPELTKSLFQALEDQANAIIRAHREAMRCRDLEDLMQFVRLLFRTTLVMIAEQQEQAAAGRSEFTADNAREWETRLRDLLPAVDATNRAIEKFNQFGYALKGLDEFHEAERDLRGMLSVSVDRIQQATDSLNAGRKRSLAEVRDELQRRVRG
jgi:hypothetical protein